MRIECPFCHTQARLSESQEGAQVRCGGCKKVYRAREKGAGSTGKSPAPWLAIGLAGGLAIVLIVALRNRGDDDVARANEPPPPPPPTPVAVVVSEEEQTGWESTSVRAARAFHELGRDADRTGLLAELAPSLSGEERDSLIDVLTDPEGLVAAWEPYEGEVVDEDDTSAVVRLSVTPVAGGAEKRTVEWRLAWARDAWRISAFEEWLSEAERRRRERGYEVVQLSDGSVVREREPEPLEHLEDTPQELRDRIDELFATMIDLDLTVEASRAAGEIAEIGKPAIPILLTHLYENELETQADSIQANIAVVALRKITGQSFGYQPQAFVGSALGTTEERRTSAIHQWFAWWYREGESFTAPPVPEEE